MFQKVPEVLRELSSAFEGDPASFRGFSGDPRSGTVIQEASGASKGGQTVLGEFQGMFVEFQGFQRVGVGRDRR